MKKKITLTEKNEIEKNIALTGAFAVAQLVEVIEALKRRVAARAKGRDFGAPRGLVPIGVYVLPEERHLLVALRR